MITKIALTHIKRSPYQAAVAVLTMLLTFVVVGFFALVTVTSALVLGYFESKPQITVFFTDNAQEQQIEKLKTELERTEKVASVTYVSKEEALAIYQEQNKDDPLLLEMVTADILPASLEVSALDPTFLKELEPILTNTEAVEEVVYQKDVVEALLSWTKAVRIIGGVLAGLLAFDAFLIVMTVIGMKIAIKKQEVEILTLVGGSPWYIRGPFIVEGGMYGTIGASLAWVLLASLVLWLRPFLLSFLGTIPSISSVLSNPLGSSFLVAAGIFFLALSGIGFLLGGLASIVAVGRYLKF